MGTVSLRDEILLMGTQCTGEEPKGDVEIDFLDAFDLEGDNANEFLEEYAERFNVDLESFLWYFHYNADEPPMYRRVKPVDQNGRAFHLRPITLEQLVQAAEAGRWLETYPEHTVRKSKILMIVLLTLLIGFGLLWLNRSQ